jgi:hypothetical protein
MSSVTSIDESGNPICENVKDDTAIEAFLLPVFFDHHNSFKILDRAMVCAPWILSSSALVPTGMYDLYCDCIRRAPPSSNEGLDMSGAGWVRSGIGVLVLALERLAVSSSFLGGSVPPVALPRNMLELALCLDAATA